MKLYLVERTQNVGYEEYDAMVVAAEDETTARNTHPGNTHWGPHLELRDNVWHWRSGHQFHKDYSWDSPDSLRVTEIGETSKYEKTTVVLTSMMGA